MAQSMYIGIDLGGTKTEIVALDRKNNEELYRKRVQTPKKSYDTVIRTIADLVIEAESYLKKTGTVGIGIPGAISPLTRKVKNANLQVLNGNSLEVSLGEILQREVRCANDANCLALSEAIDGAAAGYSVVFGAILGTGCGGGLAFSNKAWSGKNFVCGEWGHNPLPWMTKEEYPGHKCWCGQVGCQELYLSGTGFALDYAIKNTKGKVVTTGAEIIKQMHNGDAAAKDCFDRYINRLARALATVINLLDPDAIVLGGGMSNIDEIYDLVPQQLPDYVFGKEVMTPILRNLHGDSSGVRGAAWLFAEDKGWK